MEIIWALAKKRRLPWFRKRGNALHSRSRNLQGINYQPFSRGALCENIVRLVSFVLVANYASEMLLGWKYFSAVDATRQPALSRQAFCGDNGVVSRSLSFASRRNRAPYHRRTSGQTMAVDNASARSTTMDFVVFSNPRRDAHRPFRRCVPLCVRIFSLISGNLSSRFSTQRITMRAKNSSSFSGRDFLFFVPD